MVYKVPEQDLFKEHDYTVFRNVRIPMRDGVELSSNIYFPSDGGKVDFSLAYPAVVVRTPYMDSQEDVSCPPFSDYFMCERGYVVVLNAVRGTFLSGGVMDPLADEGWGERKDGVDLARWIVEQPWSNGQIVNVGDSYLAAAAYLMNLSGEAKSVGLEASIVSIPFVNNHDGGLVYSGEAIDNSAMVLYAIQRVLDKGTFENMPDDVQRHIREDSHEIGDLLDNPTMLYAPGFVDDLMRNYAYDNIPVARRLPWYRKWLENRDNPEYFEFCDITRRSHDTGIPILYMGGWGDIFLTNSLRGFAKAVKDAADAEAAKKYAMIIGPWGHVPNPLVRKFPGSETDNRIIAQEWFERCLNDRKSETFDENPVMIYVMGENRWRGEKEWPLPDAVPTRYYLHSDGSANTLMGDGRLSTEAPIGDEAPDRYVYDPANPVAARGGNGISFGGQCDQREVEMRSDVLVYTSGALAERIEVTGYVKMLLYASTSAQDTDFVAKVLDVFPDGTVYNVAVGLRRGRYLQNGRTSPTALDPGKVYAWEIALRATSYVFGAGHRIRVEITSSDSLNIEVNPNTFVDLNSCTSEDYVVANQTVFHNGTCASHIELPIIPSSHERRWLDPWPFRAELTGVNSWDYNSLLPLAPKPAEGDASELPGK